MLGSTTVTAPTSGVVAELGAREGTTVMSGALLFRISGLDTVWVNAEVPESQVGLVRPGNPVEARTPALPGTVFKGRVSALPDLGHSVHVELAGLSPGRPYWYRFRAGDAESPVGRARTAGLLDIVVHNLRDFTTDRHHVVDDVPFGGGPGMVM